MKNKKYLLEAYDKDNDSHHIIAFSDEIKTLKDIGKNLYQNFELRTKKGEPVDWFIISNTKNKKPLTYFDTYKNLWKNY